MVEIPIILETLWTSGWWIWLRAEPGTMGENVKSHVEEPSQYGGAVSAWESHPSLGDQVKAVCSLVTGVGPGATGLL